MQEECEEEQTYESTQEMNTVGGKGREQKFEDVSVRAVGFIKQPWALHPYLPHPSVAMDIRPWQHSCVSVCWLEVCQDDIIQ